MHLLTSSCRLVVTEVGRDAAIAHLEVSFVHEYVERQTVEVDQTPPQKKVRQPETWQRNKRSAQRMQSRVETSCDVDLVEGNAACAAQGHCSAQCLSVDLTHRQEVRGLARQVWRDKGEAGFTIFVEGLIHVKEPNMKTIALHGACFLCELVRLLGVCMF
jgi:hypothetical protein